MPASLVVACVSTVVSRVAVFASVCVWRIMAELPCLLAWCLAPCEGDEINTIRVPAAFLGWFDVKESQKPLLGAAAHHFMKWVARRTRRHMRSQHDDSDRLVQNRVGPNITS